MIDYSNTLDFISFVLGINLNPIQSVERIFFLIKEIITFSFSFFS